MDNELTLIARRIWLDAIESDEIEVQVDDPDDAGIDPRFLRDAEVHIYTFEE